MCLSMQDAERTTSTSSNRNNEWITYHKTNKEIIHVHFESALGPPMPGDINRENLNFKVVDFNGIDDNITKEEVKATIDGTGWPFLC